jgi:hypothetical protein
VGTSNKQILLLKWNILPPEAHNNEGYLNSKMTTKIEVKFCWMSDTTVYHCSWRNVITSTTLKCIIQIINIVRKRVFSPFKSPAITNAPLPLLHLFREQSLTGSKFTRKAWNSFLIFCISRKRRAQQSSRHARGGPPTTCNRPCSGDDIDSSHLFKSKPTPSKSEPNSF